MSGASATRALDLPQKDLPSTVEPNPSVVRSDSESLGGPVDGFPFQVHAAEKLCVLWFQCREQAHYTAADFASELGVLITTVLPLLQHGLDRTAKCRLRAMSVDEGVAQQSVDPGNGRLPITQVLALIQGAHKCTLENVLGIRAAPDSPFQEIEKAPVVVNKQLGYGIRCGVGCH
ncbi:MAG: hypothetical protein ACI9HE_003560 [Planctomycetota bacterium]|jgi:hypothetical protein